MRDLILQLSSLSGINVGVAQLPVNGVSSSNAAPSEGFLLSNRSFTIDAIFSSFSSLSCYGNASKFDRRFSNVPSTTSLNGSIIDLFLLITS